MDELVEINTDQIQPVEVGNDLYANRTALVQMKSQATAEVTIIIVAYNRLEKTRRCVSSVLTYSNEIDYDLILIDNGSTDGTLAYFKTVPYKKKKIIHITKNIGAGFPSTLLPWSDYGDFIIFLANDLIVTANWLENLLACAKSDPKIGMVNPVSSNVSNLQNVDLSFSSYDEMQRKAEKFNVSDPRKWEDRQRMITLGTMYRKEAILASGWPVADVGFFHDFGDDDAMFHIRRAGYRTVLAGDTWICHDHDYAHGESKDPVEFQKSINIGKKNFQSKYYGVDAWDDVNNYYIPFLSHFPKPHIDKNAAVLGIDVKCGTPILDIKNWLRKNGIFQTKLSAFVQDPKYWLDLKTICSGPVLCDREEFLSDSFRPASFDYVIADHPLNQYHEPQKMIDNLFSLCKSGGIVSCKLLNTYSFLEYINLLGQRDVYNQEIAYHITLEALEKVIVKIGKIHAILSIPFALNSDQQRELDGLVPFDLSKKQRQEILQRMQCKEYLLVVEKL